MTAVLAVLGRGLVAPDTPLARADDAGLTRGDGCFEGCRIRIHADGPRVDKLDDHLARFTRSAAALDLTFDEPAWRELVRTVCETWASRHPQHSEAALKLVLTRGAGGTQTGYAWASPVAAESLRQRRDGVRVITLDRGYPSAAFAATPWLLGGVKTLSYAVNMAAQREATRAGADDVLFVSSDGLVLEAPTATAVWANGRTLSTTPLGDTGILGGTTQALLFDRAAASGWTTRHALVPLDELHAADALWLISSVRGPVEVIELDGKPRDRAPELDAEIRALVDFDAAL